MPGQPTMTGLPEEHDRIFLPIETTYQKYNDGRRSGSDAIGRMEQKVIFIFSQPNGLPDIKHCAEKTRFDFFRCENSYQIYNT
jgi:hypothetical protein